MGDIYGIVQGAIKALGPLVTAEIALLFWLQDEITAIKNELQSMSVFLKNAEIRAEGDDAAKEWVRQVRMLAYDIEDAIERYQLFQKEATLGKVKHYMKFVKTILALDIKSLRGRAADIVRTRDAYKFTDDSVVMPARLTSTYFLSTNSEEVELVGAEKYKGEIIEFLGLGKLDTKPSTIAVLGMRGLGKTTVVSNVYNDGTVRSFFPVRAWVSVAVPKRHVDILRSMMVQFYEGVEGQNVSDLHSMDKNSLLRLLQNYLKDKRYMVVFDDVQEDDIELASYVKRLLPINNEGSKILMTTRYENVAFTWLDGSDTAMYRLKPLPSEKAWELFCKKTFKSCGGSCPSPLHDLAQNIVRKCGGLPPAIVSVGRLLSSKSNDVHEWKKVRHSLGFYLAENRHLSGIHKTLMQNYHDLPFYLKPCFLYFGLFPKGYPIERMRLIRLWIAEGFVREIRGDLTLEEVAEEYLNELINMSLIEAKSIDATGKVKIIGVVSEFLHEVISPKLDELSFCRILSKKDYIESEAFRRLSIHKNHKPSAFDVLVGITRDMSNIRSLFLLEVAPEITDKVFSKAFIKNARLLKVLDLFNSPIEIIPKEIGKLLNLQYLSLRCTRVSSLPSSIGKLQSLQTLDLKQTCVSEVPVEISRLCKLRHLLVYSYEYDFDFSAHSLKINGVKIPEGALGQCSELQKLDFLDLTLGNRSWATELRNTTQLRKLGILGITLDDGRDLCSVIDGMKYLQSLSVFSKDRTEDINIDDIISPPLMLERLYLSGPLLVFPTWISVLQNLVKIRLRWSNLQTDPFKTLQLLPNLVELHLLEAFLGESLHIENEGFPKLKVLHLLDLYRLKSLHISKRALPLLTEMSIGESRHLEVPDGLEYLTSLETLKFYDMSSRFVQLLQPGEECHSIVKHIPNIMYYNKHPYGYWLQTDTT
ncbi:hypothetical protein RND81_08G014000 [Saponaria officinalis]|uniref:Disease resistance protein RPM1-like n=2 Tax=Saponaria officinalis TaxID=3572 RepID=A0AAW1J3C7_SAPOF